MLTNLLYNMGFDFAAWGAAQFVLGFVTAFGVMMLFGRAFIRLMMRWQKKGQPIRKDGPESHLVKTGTPSMGGILVIAAILIASLLFMDWTNPVPWIALLPLSAYGLIGFMDDYKKIKKRNAERGLSKWFRLLAGGVIAFLVAYLANRTVPAYIPEYSITIPFMGLIPAGLMYFVYAYFVIVGSANAANITDGLDGQLAKVTLPIIGVLTAAAFGCSHIGFFANGVFMPSVAALYPVLGAAFGAVIGFLWYNAAPAQIFLGDVGSLALGGFMGAVAMLLKSEIVYAVAAIMMIVILASSFLQTIGFKITKKLTGKGKRIFNMAPLHHHFELAGWAETKVSERFFIMSMLFSGIALMLLRS